MKMVSTAASAVIGGKYLTEDAKDALVREREEAKARRVAKRRNRAMAKLALVAATAVMTYMTITGKIEDPYGVLFSVALSLLLGAQVRGRG